MKLSALKEMVSYIEARVGAYPDNPDPNIVFYKHRIEGDPRAGEKESQYFINYDIDCVDIPDCRIVTNCAEYTIRQGDYSFRIVPIPFFSAP